MRFSILLILLRLLGGLAASAQTTTQVRLFSDVEQVPPGAGFVAAVELSMAPGWHTYWRSSGDAGQPTKVVWNLPQGFSTGALRWPTPEKIVEEDLTVHAYSGVATLLVPITVDASVPPGRYDLSAKVSWLECQKSCIKGSTTVSASVVVGNGRVASGKAVAVRKAEATMPANANFPVRAEWVDAGSADKRTAEIRFSAADGSWDLFPDRAPEGNWAGKSEPAANGGTVTIRKAFTRFEKDWPTNVSGLLVRAAAAGAVTAFEFSSAIEALPTTNNTSIAIAAGLVMDDGSAASGSFSGLLFGAFLGGLILNIMPCVLPVIALKILGFVGQASQNPGRVRVMGLVYGAGVLASFLALALLVIAVKATGGTASWGMQFQNPKFLVGMTLLVLLVALNLFGVFEVILGGGAMQSASDLAGREGLGGAFFNGVLATLLATPCTAPFLGVSLGFALAQPSLMIVLFFLTAGLGLAFPYVLLCWQPAWLRYLPKPGNWMVSFKVAMGFPVLATGLWLFTLATPHYGNDRSLWLALFLVTVATAAWVYGRFIQSARKRPVGGWLIFAVLLAVGYFWFLERELKWRQPPSREPSATAHTGPIAWAKWSPEEVRRLREQGRPVLVDFTADWCTNCQINKRTSIEVKSVVERIKALNVASLLADFTFPDEAIALELQRFKRAGVPLVLVYPADLSKPPIVMPDGIFKAGTMVAALEKAAGRQPNLAR